MIIETKVKVQKHSLNNFRITMPKEVRTILKINCDDEIVFKIDLKTKKIEIYKEGE